MLQFASAGLVSVAALILVNSCATYYEGPPSDHFNGDEFFLPWSDEHKSLGDVLKWMWLSLIHI